MNQNRNADQMCVCVFRRCRRRIRPYRERWRCLWLIPDQCNRHPGEQTADWQDGVCAQPDADVHSDWGAQQCVKWPFTYVHFVCQPSGAGGSGSRSGSRCQRRRVQTPAAAATGTRKAYPTLALLTGRHRGTLLSWQPPAFEISLLAVVGQSFWFLIAVEGEPLTGLLLLLLHVQGRESRPTNCSLS